MAGLVLHVTRRRMEAGKAASLALGSASLSLPLGSIDDSPNGECFFALALKKGACCSRMLALLREHLHTYATLCL